MLFRVERDGNRSAVPDRAADSVRMSAHEGHPGAGDCPVRVDVPVTLGRALVTRKIARRAFSVDFPGPRWCASLRLTLSRTAVERSRVVCRCLEWPQAVSGFLKSAATLPTVPVRALLAVPCGRRARSVFHVVLDRRGVVATDRHIDKSRLRNHAVRVNRFAARALYLRRNAFTAPPNATQNAVDKTKPTPATE